MLQNNTNKNIYEEIENFITFKNKNRFNDYFELVLTTLSKSNF